MEYDKKVSEEPKQDDTSTREILLQIRDLLKQEVKQGEDIRRESLDYRNQERQYLEKAEKRTRLNTQINKVAIGIFIVLVIVIIIANLNPI